MINRPPRASRWFALLFLLTGTFSALAPAQCQPLWLEGPPVPGANAWVRAMVEWDPDGAGPATPVLVLGGHFTAAGNVDARCVVAFEPLSATWWPLNSTGFFVSALAVLANGDLVAARHPNDSYNATVERWNGTSWVPLGIAFNGPVNVMTVLPNGELIVGGAFTLAGGTAASRIARWNGTSWSALGSGTSAEVLALAVAPNGDLLAAGVFSVAGGVTVDHIGRWDGVAWHALGTGVSSSVAGVGVTASGDVIVAGDFFFAGSVPVTHVARWNGSSWSAMGAGLGQGGTVATLPNGDVLVGGSEVWRWNGAAWSQLGDAAGGVYGILPLANGSIFVRGDFGAIDAVAANNVAVWTGSAWSQLGPPSVPTDYAAVTAAPNGDPIIAAETPYSTGTGNRVSRWTGTSWVPMGPVFIGGAPRVLLTTANGDVVAGGSFSTVGGVTMNRVARWNGTSWLPMGSGMSGSEVQALVELPGGDIVAGGNFVSAGGVPAACVARWNGSTWSALGAGLSGSVAALAIAANGDIVAGGFITGNARVARWNGTTWVGLGSMSGSVLALAVRPNGDIVAGGGFSFADGAPVGRIARWNGSVWQGLGLGMTSTTLTPPSVAALAILANGDLVAGGAFDAAGGLPAAGVARWDGVQWTAMATSVTAGFARALRDLTIAPDGSVLGAGATSFDGVVSAGFSRLWTTCPPAATSSAAGCTGSGGANVLAATSSPWTGSTYRGVATGLPATGLALDVYGLSTLGVPLPAIVPQGVAGCTLHVTPDFVVTLVPAAGAAATQLPIPNTPTLAGALVYEQVLALEFTGAGFVALTGTNRLTLTLGTF